MLKKQNETLENVRIYQILTSKNNSYKISRLWNRGIKNKVSIILTKIYFEQMFKISEKSIKQTWELINEIIKRKKKESLYITEFKYNNEPVTDCKEIVNRFNDYFANVGYDLARKINVDTSSTFKSYLKGNFMDSMMLSPVCETKIQKELENLDASKSCGHDNVMPKVVKNLAAELAVPLT